jgi:uncharacterized protein YaaW (UPF0174 family)
VRKTESLSKSRLYKDNYPNHKKYLDQIFEEIQRFGGNTIVNFARGGLGVEYRKILIDVAKKFKVNFQNNSDTKVIEKKLLEKIIIDSIENMSQEELKKFVEDFNIKVNKLTPQAVLGAIQIIIKNGGFKPYKISVRVANAVAKQILGKGFSLAGNAAITKGISLFVGPVGLIITSLWTIIGFAGPAFRVTIPIVLHVAYLRIAYTETCVNDNKI